MKNPFIYFCLALLCLTACNPPKPASWQNREMSMANLQEQFANPSKEYRPAPLWVWNTNMTEEDIDRMLQDFKDDVKEVKSGFECGLVFEGFDKVAEFDQVEAYIMVEVPR